MDDNPFGLTDEQTAELIEALKVPLPKETVARIGWEVVTDFFGPRERKNERK